jgi:flagellin
LSVTGGTTGVKLTFDNNLAIASFAPGGGADASLQLTAGAKTYAFEFTDDSLGAPIPLQTAQNSTTQIVAVHINSTTQSTNQIVGALITAVQNTGFGVQQNTDGSLNILGNGVTAASFGSVTGGTFTASATIGVTSAALTGTQAVISTVQNAVTSVNTISANLGAATQQITGIQNFTSELSSALTAGVGALTDADLAAESARLTSLQTKQQLATQALSIANQQPQSLLTLFRNA